MNRLFAKTLHHKLRQARVRARISGTAVKPRLSVHISNRHVSAQLIDDNAGKTLAQVTSVGQKTLKGNLTEKAVWVGEEIAKKAASVKIAEVVYDRGAKLYHGHVKALADAARAKGLRF